MAKLGIVAGGGHLPKLVIAACQSTDREFHVLAVEGSADDELVRDVPADWIRIDALSETLAVARKNDIKELVFAGGVPRPSPLQLLRDPVSARLLMKLGSRVLGDNDILSAVVDFLEESQGFRVIAPDDVLKNGLAARGSHGTVEPDRFCTADIGRGLEVGAAVGMLDVGQAVIIQNGTVLGIEAVEGTDRLLERCGAYVCRDAPGGVLVKISKPGQEHRVDLPAIGLTTIEKTARAGLRGVAVEAGRSWIIDREETVQAADRSGLFLVGVVPPGRE